MKETEAQAGREPRVWVVTPTYNERENILTTCSAIHAVAPTAKVLVVDDSSPDGTAKVVREEMVRSDWLQILERPAKNGLGVAYRAGFEFVIDRGAEMIVQMDADGSHPANLVPRLLERLESADLALASRYVRGGSMRIDLYRRLVSGLGNSYLRWILGQAVHDWSTGFKAWRAETLRRVLSHETTAVGYAWLMESTWLAMKLGARIVEEPLVFEPRKAGQSKFSVEIAREDLRVAWDLRHRTLA